MSNNVEMVTITKERYIELLEAHYEQSAETRRVRETLQAEYNFAEEKIKEINVFKEFIESAKDIECRYKKFIDAKASAETTDSESTDVENGAKMDGKDGADETD